MLYRQELNDIPFKTKKEEKLYATVSVENLKRSGKILAVNFLQGNDLICRFFADGKNYIIRDTVNDKWTKTSVVKLLQAEVAKCTKTELDVVIQYLDIELRNLHYSCHSYQKLEGVISAIEIFCEAIRDENNRKRADSYYERLNRHLKMFPERYGKEISRFCDKEVFEAYIFFSNLDKQGNRTGHCSKCGKTFKVPKSAKHKVATACPKCKTPATYWAERYASSISTKMTICIPMKRDNQLLVEWVQVTRYFDEQLKPYHSYMPTYRLLYLNDKGKEKIYSYRFFKNFYYYCDFWANQKGRPFRGKAYVYTKDLNKVFGEKYYNVNLKHTLESSGIYIDFIGLLDRLKNIPSAEYLCKMGLAQFVSDVDESYINHNGHSFSEVMGVTKQYLPLYRDKAVNKFEHLIMQSTKDFFTSELLERLRNTVEITRYTAQNICILMQYMTLNKLLSYIRKQEATNYHQTERSIVWLKDYIRMSEGLDIRLTKSNLFPKDVKKAHDMLLPRYTEVKNELEEKRSKEALRVVNEFFKRYSDDNYTVKVPKSKSDFVKEGQELSHCVGSGSYYDNHIKGNKMIFFIRKTENPEKAYFTCEIDMIGFSILQLYGKGDCIAPKKVRTFANGLVRHLKQQCKAKAV